MKSEFQPFACAECGSQVVLRTETNLRRQFQRGVWLIVSPDLELPQCSGCGEVYLDAEYGELVDADLRKQLAEKGS